MNELSQKSCSTFIDLLASKSPAPGGGGAAALVGALGVALSSMVGNYTIGKKKYINVENDIRQLQTKNSLLQARLLELVDEDAESFELLTQAYTMPKDTLGYQSLIVQATMNACKAPVETIEICVQALAILEEMMKKGNKNLISDVGCGILLCQAAMKSAALNVYVNTNTIRNYPEAKKIESRIKFLIEESLPKAEKDMENIMELMR